MSWVPISICTRLSTICTHESSFHVSQILVAAPLILPLQLHHSRMIYWNPSGVPSISLLHPMQVYIWWKCISLRVQMSPHSICLLSRRSHVAQTLPCVFHNTICNMLDLVDPLRSCHWLSFWSRNYLPNIILHNRLVLLDHGILPFFFSFASS